MDLIKDSSNVVNLNIGSFSKMIGQTWNVSENVLANYILANVSIAMIRNAEMKKDINKLYLLDKIKYYEAVKNSSCSKHIIMTQGTLEQEIEGKKALGILLIAENDYNLRSTIINLLRKHYCVVFNAVKKHDKRELTKRYHLMDEVTMKTEARLEAAIYFYFGIYRKANEIDQGFFKSIINDIKAFEFCDPMTRDITKELEVHKNELQEIKSLLKREYGKINSFKDILNSNINIIEESGEILENIFIINKLDVNHLFTNSNFLNIDEILLSYIKMGYTSLDPKAILQVLVNGIFIKSLINEYKKSKNLYFENNQEILHIKINTLEDNLNTVNVTNKDISNKLMISKKENTKFEDTLNIQINKVNKTHNSEVVEMQNRINDLENQLLVEKRYRTELNGLREYVFKINNDYIPLAQTKSLSDYISNFNIIIIGGAKDWRRKFREKYPELRTLHGFSENFDTSVLANCDYVFFYPGFMNHATYYKAMSFIRTNQLKFGYIGKTNIDLVELEIIDELEKGRL